VSVFRGDGPPLVVGHRGAAALARENTLEAIEAGLEHGVDAVEFDVVADGDRLVLGHSLRLLRGGEATLDDALARLAAAGVSAHVDLKGPGGEAAVVAALRERGMLERALVSSVDRRALRDLRTLEPRLATGLGYPKDRYELSERRLVEPFVPIALAALKRTIPHVLGRRLERTGASAAVLHHALLTPGLVERCHRRGVAVWAWTVNDRATAARLAEAGVDAIITDDPRVVRAPAASERP